jgi:hypothetical protein
MNSNATRILLFLLHSGFLYALRAATGSSSPTSSLPSPILVVGATGAMGRKLSVLCCISFASFLKLNLYLRT